MANGGNRMSPEEQVTVNQLSERFGRLETIVASIADDVKGLKDWQHKQHDRDQRNAGRWDVFRVVGRVVLKSEISRWIIALCAAAAGARWVV